MPKIGMRTKQPSLSALTRNAGHTQMKIDFGGKQIALKDLPSKTPITFRTEEDGKRAVDIKVPPK